VTTDDTKGPDMTAADALHHPTSAPHRSDSYRPRPAARRPAFWRAPFASATYREIGYAVTGLPLAIAGFVLVITLFSVGVGLVVTVAGLPVLALMLTTARGFGAVERGRVNALLGTELTAPAPVRPARPGVWGTITSRLADPAGWKAALHQILMFPWAIASFAVSITFLLVGWVYALYPLYHWVFARYTSWPGYQFSDWTDSHGVHHAYYVTAPWQIAGVSLIGFALVFLTPGLIHAMTSVNRLAARALLTSH